MDPLPDLQKRVLDLEVNVLEQEHRLPQLFLRFWTRNVDYPEKSDPRRTAVIKALFFGILFSPAGVAIGGSILTVATLTVLIWQTNLMSESNEMLREQLSPKTEAYLHISKVAYVEEKGIEIEGTVHNAGSAAILIQQVLAGYDYKDGGASSFEAVQAKPELLSPKAIAPIQFVIPWGESFSRKETIENFRLKSLFHILVQIQSLQTRAFYAKISFPMKASHYTMVDLNGLSTEKESFYFSVSEGSQTFGDLEGDDLIRVRGWGWEGKTDLLSE